MPLFRYFIFVGSFLICCFLALDHINGPSVSRTQQQDMPSLQAWRNAEARKEATKDGRDTSVAIVMPNIATLSPTPERLTYERQLASNAVPTPLVGTEATRTVIDARAQMSDAQPREKLSTQTTKPKTKRKSVVAAAQIPPQPQRNPEFAGFFFGRIFNN